MTSLAMRFGVSFSLILLAVSLNAQPRPLNVSAQPVLTLGADESNQATTFTAVVGATRLPNGRIIVGDRAEMSLKVFSAQGKLIKSYGRKGSGPGELSYLAHFWRCGSEFFTYDIDNGNRTSVFTLEGAYQRQFRFGSPQKSTPYATSCNAAQQFVHFGWEVDKEMKGGTFRSNVPFWFSRGDERIGVALGEFAGSERYGLVEGGAIRGTRPLALGKHPSVAIGSNRAYVGTADSFAIMVFDLSGKRIGLLNERRALVPVTKNDIDEEHAREIASDGKNWKQGIERDYAKMTFPKSLPAYSAFLIDALDKLWVKDFPRSASSTVRWSTFSNDGKAEGQVLLPTNLDVFEIGTDYILGRYLDPKESVPQVRLYKLTR